MNRLPNEILPLLHSGTLEELYQVACKHYNPKLMAMGQGTTLHGFIVDTRFPVLLDSFALTKWTGEQTKTEYLNIASVAKRRLTCLSDELAAALALVNDGIGRIAASQAKVHRALNAPGASAALAAP
jgi:hypothetical protein